MNRQIIIIAGPTAVGKTEYAIETAKAIDGEIVSADSMQLYKYMDIGSAKPSKSELAQVKHYLVDQIDPREKFSVAKYQRLAKAAILEIFAKGKTPVISGGTGLYINSLMYEMDFAAGPADESLRKQLEQLASEKGREYLHMELARLDPEAAARIHPNNTQKIIRAIEAARNGSKVKSFDNASVPTADYDVLLAGLTRDRAELYDRINTRVDMLVSQGLADEVASLMQMGLGYDDISMKGIGYKEIIGFYEGRYSLDEAIELIKKNTRHYAKRQLTWLRRYDIIKWFNLSDYEDKAMAMGDILRWLNTNKNR